MRFLSVVLIGAVMLTCTAQVWAVVEAPAKEVTTSPEGCTIEKFTVHSPTMDRDIKAVVVLPPGYDADAGKTYPVIYALHGRGAPYTVWSDMSLLRKELKNEPMIIASFDGDHHGWYVNATAKPDSQFKTFFFREFMPTIESTYRTSGVRGLTGFSMGGYGAMNFYLEAPEKFASVSVLSAAIGYVFEPSKPYKDIPDLFGMKVPSDEIAAQNAIIPRLKALVATEAKLAPMLIHCGTEDYLVERSRELQKVLIEQNKLIAKRLESQVTDETNERARRKKLGKLMLANQIDFTYVESPGAHTWTFWLNASPRMADFHWRAFQKAKPAPLASSK